MLQGEGVAKVAVVGPSTIQRMMAENRIDELTLVLVPRALGHGITLLPSCQLSLIGTPRDIGAGWLELRYKPDTPQCGSV
jgi:hypothetical protein